ncbi:hypothetical protein H6G89_01160 [Oscillatoria sp. FACHB-1407]|uniref:hypothetical protein n=1 Tax=Oscillatoria sp. FACHB-1407 TaxID=2692847 RepID=UPI001685043A|nr:hypothetical protein [Oscillatoria sp. FACHB-1407]MBD2459638.1 hypothetical protein [Oscillatoria sp. FACHB-1407]
MLNLIRIVQLLIITAMGIISTTLTVSVFGLIEAWTGFALYSIMFLIIPLGAGLAGFISGIGYYLGCRLLHQQAGFVVTLNVLLTSVGAYFLVHYVPYYLIEVEGVRVKDLMPFWNYLDLDIRHTSLIFGLRGMPIIPIGEIGSIFGYIYALIQLIGFALGGLAILGWLLEAPFCEQCSRYLKKTNTQQRYASEEFLLLGQIQYFKDILDSGRYLKALEFHADQMGNSKRKRFRHNLKTRIIIRRCKRCGISHLEFEAFLLKQWEWKNVPETRIRSWAGHELDAANIK